MYFTMLFHNAISQWYFKSLLITQIGAAVELDPMLLFKTLDGVLLQYLKQAAAAKGACHCGAKHAQ